jgi:hypothetical protein
VQLLDSVDLLLLVKVILAVTQELAQELIPAAVAVAPVHLVALASMPQAVALVALV